MQVFLANRPDITAALTGFSLSAAVAVYLNALFKTASALNPA